MGGEPVFALSRKAEIPFLQRHVAPAVADDQVIDQIDVKQLAGLDDGACEADIIIIYMENLFDTLFLSR